MSNNVWLIKIYQSLLFMSHPRDIWLIKMKYVVKNMEKWKNRAFMTHKLWVMKNDVISKSHMTSWILSKKIKSIHPCGSAKERFKGKNVFLSTTTTWYFSDVFFPKRHSTGYDLSYESWLMVYDSRHISIWAVTKFHIFKEKKIQTTYANRLHEFLNICGV